MRSRRTQEADLALGIVVDDGAEAQIGKSAIPLPCRPHPNKNENTGGFRRPTRLCTLR